MVTNELRGERVDVVPFSDDPVELIQNALAPARVREVRLDEETGTATVVVSDYQLSLAIGKEGQNARLAARLTGWRIDIKSETQLAEEEAGYAGQEWAEGEWVENEAGEMVWKPAEGGEAISAEEWTHAAEEPADEAAPSRRRPRQPAPRSSPARRGAGDEPADAGRRPTPCRTADAAGRSRGRSAIAPVRTCVGCRRKAPVGELVRVGRGPDGIVGRGPGATRARRLALSGPAGLPDRAVRRRAFARALRAPVDDERYEALRTPNSGQTAADVRG